MQHALEVFYETNHHKKILDEANTEYADACKKHDSVTGVTYYHVIAYEYLTMK